MKIKCAVPCPKCGVVAVEPDLSEIDEDIPQRGSVPTSGICPRCNRRLTWGVEDCYSIELVPDALWAAATEVLLTVSKVKKRVK